MEREITALLPRGPQTAVLPTYHTREHPSFVNALPAIIAEPVALGYCTDCAYLARMIRAGRHVEQYGLLAIGHVAASHPECAP